MQFHEAIQGRYRLCFVTTFVLCVGLVDLGLLGQRCSCGAAFEAVRWADMSLSDFLQEVVRDDSVLNSIRARVGLPQE